MKEEFSRFGIGTLHMGSLLDKEMSKKILFRCIDKRINFFDTAPLYGNSNAEEILGDVLSDVSEKTFICTKAGLKISNRKDGRFGVEVSRLNAKNLTESVEKSLKRLKRDSIDLLMLHAFDQETPLDETLEALSKLHEKGKIKNLGCSNYNPNQLKYLIKQTRNNSIPLIAAQCHYNLIERRSEKIFIPICKQEKIYVVVNRALARGALTGQYGLKRQIPIASRASMSSRIRQWLTPNRLKLLDSLSRIADDYGFTLTEISLKWILKNHSQAVILIGVRKLEQLDQCISVLSREVEPKVFEKIEQVLQKEKNVYTQPSRYFEK